MKLNQISGKKLRDLLCKTAVTLEHITQDPELDEIIKAVQKGQSEKELFYKTSGLACSKTLLFVTKHWDDFVSIISAVSDKTEEQIECEDIVEPVRILLTQLGMDGLKGFFTSFVGMVLKELFPPSTDTETPQA